MHKHRNYRPKKTDHDQYMVNNDTIVIIHIKNLKTSVFWISNNKSKFYLIKN